MKKPVQHSSQQPRLVATRIYNRIRSSDSADLPDGYSGHRPVSVVWLIKNLCHSMVVARTHHADFPEFAQSLMFEETPEHYAFHQSFYELADMFTQDKEGEGHDNNSNN